MPETYGLPERNRDRDHATDEFFVEFTDAYQQLRQLDLGGGTYMGHDALTVAVAHPEYIRFARVVAPYDYAAAHNRPHMTVAEVIRRLVNAGYKRSDLPRLSSFDDDEPLTHTAELARAAAIAADIGDGSYPWLADLTEDELVEALGDEESVNAPKGRPASLEGYERTEGRPDRPSRDPAYRREQRRRRQEFEQFHYGDRS